MEALLITPKNKIALSELNSFLKERKYDFATKEVSLKETLDNKILNLYQGGHYSEKELKMFFNIPKKYRVDPFDIIEDGDIFYADKRNINQLEKDLEQGRKDLKKGKTISLKTTDNFQDFCKQIREYEI